MSQNLNDDKSTLAQVMAWCRQSLFTQINVDPNLCHQMESLGHSELKGTINSLWSGDAISEILVNFGSKEYRKTYNAYHCFMT